MRTVIDENMKQGRTQDFLMSASYVQRRLTTQEFLDLSKALLYEADAL